MRSKNESPGEIEDIGRELRSHIVKKYGTRQAAAEALSINVTSLSSMLSGKRHPAESLLADAGIKAIKQPPFKYVRIERRRK